MQELEQAITSIIDKQTNLGLEVSFLELSKKWATFSLETYKDGLLTKGLAISKALAEFDCELRDPGQWL